MIPAVFSKKCINNVYYTRFKLQSEAGGPKFHNFTSVPLDYCRIEQIFLEYRLSIMTCSTYHSTSTSSITYALLQSPHFPPSDVSWNFLFLLSNTNHVFMSMYKVTKFILTETVRCTFRFFHSICDGPSFSSLYLLLNVILHATCLPLAVLSKLFIAGDVTFLFFTPHAPVFSTSIWHTTQKWINS